jgi:2-iminobutanoate/2-iminopropanoate deaminase
MINRVPNDRIYDAARRVFDQAARDGREMAFAVADEAAGLVFAARTDGCAARVLTHAVRKAYTAAVMRRDTVTFRDGDREAGKTLADWGDPQLTHLVGGAVLSRDGEHWGGVGVGGNTTERDGELALLARDLLLHGASRRHQAAGPDVRAFGDSVGYAAREDLFALTGVTGVDPVTGKIPEAPEAEFAQAFTNVSALAEHFGFGLDEVGRVTVFTPDPSGRRHIDPGWLEAFPGDNRPARKTTHVPLRKGLRVELEVVGARGARQAIEIEGVRHSGPLPMGARVGRHVFSSVIVSDMPGSGGRRPERAGAIAQAFANMASFAEAAGGTLDDISNVWTYLGMWDLHPEYVDIWVATFADEASRPSRKTFYYPRTDIQLQCEMVLGGKRRTLEIPGIGHHDPIPMGVVTGGVFTTSGVDGRDPETGKPPRGVRAQAAMVLQNLQRLLDQASFPRSALLHVTGLVGEQSYGAQMSAAWSEAFPDPATAPAFQLMELGLPARDLLVQVIARGVAG